MLMVKVNLLMVTVILSTSLMQSLCCNQNKIRHRTHILSMQIVECRLMMLGFDNYIQCHEQHSSTTG